MSTDLESRLRETPLRERLKRSAKMIGRMCAEGRCPKMSIPVSAEDEDFYITTTIDDALAALPDAAPAVGEDLDPEDWPLALGMLRHRDRNRLNDYHELTEQDLDKAEAILRTMLVADPADAVEAFEWIYRQATAIVAHADSVAILLKHHATVRAALRNAASVRAADAEKVRGSGERDGGVWIHPQRCGGAPCVTGTRIPVSQLAGMHSAGDSIAELASHYDLTEDEVRFAIQYAAMYPSPAEAAQPNPAASEAARRELNRILSYAFKEARRVDPKGGGEIKMQLLESQDILLAALRRLAELEKTQPTQEQVREAWKGLRHYAEDSLEGKLEAILDPAYKDVGCCDTSIRAIAAALPTPADAEEKR